MDLHVRIPGPLQYLIHEQAKSIVYLQDLQNEVGSLLEFRELVMSTFPQLQGRVGMATADPSPPLPAPTTVSSAPPRVGGTVTSRKSQVPVLEKDKSKKQQQQQQVGRSLGSRESENETSDELVQSTWSNSSAKSSGELRIRKTRCIHEGGGGLTTGSGGIQDSGFSTETKEHHSSSTLLSPGSHQSSGNKSVPSGASGDPIGSWPISTGSTQDVASSGDTDKIGNEDELWNLLDVIHRKSVRLRQEVVQLQHHQHQQQRRVPQPDPAERNAQSLPLPGNTVRRRRRLPDVSTVRRRVGPQHTLEDDDEVRRTQLSRAMSEVDQLRKERHLLLERLNGLERVALMSQARTGELERRMRRMAEEKRSLESQLRTAVNLKAELNTKIHTLHSQFVRSGNRREAKGTTQRSQTQTKPQAKPVRQKPPSLGSAEESLSRASQEEESSGVSKGTNCRVRLGSLDTALGTPDLVMEVKGRPMVRPDRRKVSAVLQESNVVELQRQVLLLLLACEALRSQREEESRSWSQQRNEWSYHKMKLEEETVALRETNEDLQFKIQEQLIELENLQAILRDTEQRHSSLPVTSAQTQTEAPWSTLLGLNRPLLPRSPSVRHFGVQTEQPASDPGSRGLIRFELALPSQDLPRVLGVNNKEANGGSNPGNVGSTPGSPQTKTEGKRPSRIPVKPPLSPTKRDMTPKHSWRRESLTSRRDSSSSLVSKGTQQSLTSKTSNGSMNNKESSRKEARSQARERLSSSKERVKGHHQVEAGKPAGASVRRRHPAGQRRLGAASPPAPLTPESFQRKELPDSNFLDLLRHEAHPFQDGPNLESRPRSNPTIPTPQEAGQSDARLSWPMSPPASEGKAPHFRFYLEWGPLNIHSDSSLAMTANRPPTDGEVLLPNRFPVFLEDPRRDSVDSSMVSDSLEGQGSSGRRRGSKVPSKALHGFRNQSPQ